MNKTVKLITAITGLLVAIGTLVGAITVTLGGGDDKGYSYTTIISVSYTHLTLPTKAKV